MNDRDFHRRDPIIATRGDLPDSSENFNRRDADDLNEGAQHAPGGGLWKALTVISLLGFLGVGGFAWRQSVAQAELLARFDELSAKISSTDESLNQSGATIALKLKEQADELGKHRTEIKKLWTLANETNRKALADNKAALDGLKSRLDGQDKTLKNVDQSTAALKSKIEGELKRLDSTSSSALATSAAVDDLAAQVKSMSEKLNGLDKSLRESQAALAARVRENEQAIRSIDTFRREINQQLQDIRQQRSAPATAP